MPKVIDSCNHCKNWNNKIGELETTDWGYCNILSKINKSSLEWVIYSHRRGEIREVEHTETRKDFGCVYWKSGE